MISIYFNTDIPYHYYSTIKLSNSKKKHDIIILPISAWMKKALLFWIYPYFIIIIMIKKLKSVYLLPLVTQCSVQSISVQLCFDSEKQRSFPTIKFTFIVIYTYIIIIIILTTQVRKVSIFPIPKKWQICCNQIIKAGENLFFLYFIMIKTEFTFLTYESVKK